MLHPQGKNIAGKIVSSLSYGKTVKNEKPFCNLQVETAHGLLEWIGYLSDAAIEQTEKTLDEIGYDGTASSVNGKPCFLTVEHESFEGTEIARIKWLNGPSRASMFSKPLSTNEIALVAGRLKAAAAVRRAKQGQAAGTPAKAPSPVPDTDPADDLAF
jgi:hypothetical protein